jgi:hypothetical protein
MRKLSILIIALLVLGLMLVACSTAEEEATPVEEEAPAEEVAEEPAEEPAEEEVAEEPGETEGAAPAQDGAWCSDTKIVFFPGGPPGGPFAQVVANGAVAAAADLGADVEYVWSDWNPEQMVTPFAEAAAT